MVAAPVGARATIDRGSGVRADWYQNATLRFMGPPLILIVTTVIAFMFADFELIP